MTTTLNGRLPRKQLSDQLDRMDTLIDGLADALPEAVAEACREGARQAVKEAIVELLTNPDLRAQLTHIAPQAPVSVEPIAAQPTRWQRLKAKLLAFKSRVQQQVSTTKNHAKTRCQRYTYGLTSFWVFLRQIPMLKRIAIVSGAIGGIVAIGSYLCPHYLSALIGGVGMACTAIAVQLGIWFRRMAHGIGLGNR